MRGANWARWAFTVVAILILCGAVIAFADDLTKLIRNCWCRQFRSFSCFYRARIGILTIRTKRESCARALAWFVHANYAAFLSGIAVRNRPS